MCQALGLMSHFNAPVQKGRTSSEQDFGAERERTAIAYTVFMSKMPVVLP